MRSWKGFSPGPMLLSWFPRCWEEMRWKARVGNKTGREARGTVRIQTLLLGELLIQSTSVPHYEGILR